MFLLGFLPSAESLKAQKERVNALLGQAKDWTPDAKLEPKMPLTAASFQRFIAPWCDMWPELMAKPNAAGPRDAEAPRVQVGDACVVVRDLPRGYLLNVRQGNRAGFATFDSVVRIPMLYLRRSPDVPWGGFDNLPIMSLTPSECLSLRGGTRAAKGHTVIAGLGLGYSLKQILDKPSVKRVTLVEKSQDVIDLVMPRLKAILPDKPVEVVCGDAKKLVPEIPCDAVVADVDSGYGSNRFPRCPKAGRVWVWGSARLAG